MGFQRQSQGRKVQLVPREDARRFLQDAGWQRPMRGRNWQGCLRSSRPVALHEPEEYEEFFQASNSADMRMLSPTSGAVDFHLLGCEGEPPGAFAGRCRTPLLGHGPAAINFVAQTVLGPSLGPDVDYVIEPVEVECEGAAILRFGGTLTVAPTPAERLPVVAQEARRQIPPPTPVSPGHRFHSKSNWKRCTRNGGTRTTRSKRARRSPTRTSAPGAHGWCLPAGDGTRRR